MGTQQNPNNCLTCEHYTAQFDGKEEQHCYMFKDEPDDVCMQHTGRTEGCRNLDIAIMRLLYRG